ncbi:MAG: hypothetical protein UY82_C0058G0007 [Candidatus Uhrbacteria bacterium GW2011_GWC2_53_7]|uniref:Caib/baif family protein n=1 Tax=Candidatus Uhrbacteria bacterium GW2011_GWC2_53_7 TaxID=1618986 RepID=A0A0G2A1V0_9BACT|nr:MAG: hypothetical protein UY82_C0058G0007 [Candidatus Uhrbacteria bacterium GW2011_GWC2_53_7]
MIKTPNFDLKIKKLLDEVKPGERICPMSGETWQMTDEEISWYRKFNVPPQERSPLTRIREMMTLFIGYEWWYHKHPQTGKQVVSLVHPATGIQVLPDKEWFEKDFSNTIMSYDKEKPFFEQFFDFYKQIPVNALRNLIEPENSIAMASFGNTNSYFTVASKTKNSLYCSQTEADDSAEIYASKDIHRSYNVAFSQRIHGSKFILQSRDCLNSAFLFDCRNCEFCFGATNQRNKTYLWWNEQLSQKEWEKRFAEMNISCRSKLQPHLEQFHNLVGDAVWPENFNEGVENCTGEYLFDSTNLSHCYYAANGSQDQYRTTFSFGESRDCAYSVVFQFSNNLYSCWLTARSANCKFCIATTQCDGLEYSINCYNCTDCFGCIGLQRKKFCIFNVQYGEKDYWKELDEIKCILLDRGEYGIFFPAWMSHAYVPTSGAVFMYLATREDLQKLGARFFEPESSGAAGAALEGTSFRSSSEVPDCANGLTNEWLNTPILDEKIGRRFAYLKPEQRFYQDLKIAPPNNHFTERIKNLFRQCNTAISEKTTCYVCKKDVTTYKNQTYQNRKIYCKACYHRHLETT